MNRRRNEVRDRSIGAEERTRLRRIIDREWAHALTSSEVKCLVFLFNMTTDWGKTADRVKQDHFVNGVKNVAGTGLSLRTVIRVLASLTEKGIVERLRTPHGHVYVINYDWKPPVRTRVEEASSTPEPESADTPVICQSGTSRYAKLADAYVQEIPFQEIPLNRPADGAAPVRVRKRLPPKRAPYVDPLDIKNLRAVWLKIHAEVFPDTTVPTWKRGEESQAKLFVHVDAKAKRTNALEVFTWAIRKWRLLVKSRFAWMTKSPPPEFPNIGFMLKFKDQIYDAWNDRERLSKDLTVSSDERQVRKLTHAGLSPEEARAKVGQQSREAELRDKLAEAHRQLNAAHRRAEANAIQAARQPRVLAPRQPREVPSAQNSQARDDEF